MNLLQAAESIIRSRMDEYGYIMNSCLHDQKTENFERMERNVWQLHRMG